MNQVILNKTQASSKLLLLRKTFFVFDIFGQNSKKRLILLALEYRFGQS